MRLIFNLPHDDMTDDFTADDVKRLKRSREGTYYLWRSNAVITPQDPETGDHIYVRPIWRTE